MNNNVNNNENNNDTKEIYDENICFINKCKKINITTIFIQNYFIFLYFFL